MSGRRRALRRDLAVGTSGQDATQSLDSGQHSYIDSDAAYPNRIPDGAIAQLGERLNGIQEVRGSTPLGSTRHPLAIT